MPETLSPAAMTPASALKTLRLIWAALLMGQLSFLVVIVVLWNGGFQARGFDDTVRMMFMLSIVFLAGTITLGYFIRMQIYKSGWQGQVVSPGSYFTGNLMLLAMLEGASLFALVVTLLNGSLWPTVLPAVAAMAVQVINFPNGQALAPAQPQFGQAGSGGGSGS